MVKIKPFHHWKLKCFERKNVFDAPGSTSHKCIVLPCLDKLLSWALVFSFHDEKMSKSKKPCLPTKILLEDVVTVQMCLCKTCTCKTDWRESVCVCVWFACPKGGVLPNKSNVQLAYIVAAVVTHKHTHTRTHTNTHTHAQTQTHAHRHTHKHTHRHKHKHKHTHPHTQSHTQSHTHANTHTHTHTHTYTPTHNRMPLWWDLWTKPAPPHHDNATTQTSGMPPYDFSRTMPPTSTTAYAPLMAPAPPWWQCTPMPPK